MMHSEFLKLTGLGENYISFNEYTEYVEPIYLESYENITKEVFCEKLYAVLESVVYPTVESVIHNIPKKDMMMYALGGGKEINEKFKINEINKKARLLAYEVLKLQICPN